jgi:hypothetical protein
MSAKIALTVLLTVASVHGTAFAQNSEYFHATPGRPGAQIPADARGAVESRARISSNRASSEIVFGGIVVGRDPDAKVRLEILRDGMNAGQY